MTAHTDVGAYSMGLLEEQDKRAFEEHLAGCPACTAELAELSPMAALLRGAELRGAELRGVEPAGALLAPWGTAHPSSPETQVTERPSQGTTWPASTSTW